MGNKKTFKTHLIIKSLVGALMTIFICVVFTALSISEGEMFTDATEFVMYYLMSALMGAICMGSSVVYEIESWSLVKVTVTHYVISFVAFFTTSLCLKWFDNKTLMIALLIFTLAYFLIWLIEYLIWKKEIRNLNRELQSMIGKQGR